MKTILIGLYAAGKLFTKYRILILIHQIFFLVAFKICLIISHVCLHSLFCSFIL